MKITKEQIDKKLLEIAEFEAKWGECDKTRAIKKYCNDKIYRSRVDEFQRTSANLVVGYEKYKK